MNKLQGLKVINYPATIIGKDFFPRIEILLLTSNNQPNINLNISMCPKLKKVGVSKSSKF